MKRRDHHSHTFCFPLLIGLLCLILPACASDGHLDLFGYTTKPNYDPNIRTVRVPMFKNETFRRGLEFDLTAAIIREIESKTPYKVVPAGQPADAELIGTIVSRNKNVVNFNQLGEVRDADTTMAVEVVWRDLRCAPCSDPLTAAQALDPTLPPGVLPSTAANQKVLIQSLGSFRPELGQSLTSAEQEMIDGMAVRIVSMMEQPW